MPRNRSFLKKLSGLGVLFMASLTLATPWPTDQPAGALQFQNAHVETRALQGPLKDEIQRWASASTKARWLGYAVDAIDGERSICCSNYHGNSNGPCETCPLENEHSGVHVGSQIHGNTKVHLEGSGELAVLFRAENGKMSKIRVFSLNCVADAGGLDILWLENVKGSESVSLLRDLVTEGKAFSGEERYDSVAKSDLVAIALHGDPSAERALESLVSPDQPEWLRRDTAFWLGEARGAEGLQALQHMAHHDPSTHVREQVTFALSVSDQSGAIAEMIRMAHEDESARVRGQALFWLAHKAGKKAESTITGAIENDPDTEVKKKAVFALSQMPKDQGIPKLIEVALTNKNPEVRKQAMFWLGQSEDPRALAFFEKVLAQ